VIEPSARTFLERMPKVELHVHLEGSIPPATLLALAARNDVPLPAEDVDGLLEWFRFKDFAEFVEIYLTCSRCLKTPQDFYDLTLGFAAEQARQKILYTEAHFTVGTHLANGVDGKELADAMAEALAEAERASGVVVRLIPDIVRDVGVERADRTLEWAVSMSKRGVVALGLSGFEYQPDAPYKEHFHYAGLAGLGRTAHAGEHEGPETVRSVLDLCQVDRVGHGIRAIEDPELVQNLVDREIPLEICPTSNVALGAVAKLSEHPFASLERLGVDVTVNSDDPTFFSTTLTEEFVRLHETFGFGIPKLTRFVLTALRHAFLPEEKRESLAVDFRRQFLELGETTLGAPIEPLSAQ